MKFPKKLLFILVAFVIIAGGGFYYFTGTPEYSLYQIKKSAENHNWNKFQHYVDVNKILDNSIDIFTDLHLNSNSSSDSLHADTSQAMTINVGSMIAKGFMFFLKPELKKMLRSELKYFIEHGEFEKKKETEDESNNEINLSTYWDALNPASSFKDRSLNKVSDDTAISSFIFEPKGLNKEIRLEIKMTKQEHYWKIVEVSNLKEVLQSLDKAK